VKGGSADATHVLMTNRKVRQRTASSQPPYRAFAESFEGGCVGGFDLSQRKEHPRRTKLAVVHRLSDIEMPFLSHGSHSVRYELDGPENGPGCVLVKGLTQYAELWRGYRDALVAKDFRVLTFDLLGQGESDNQACLSNRTITYLRYGRWLTCSAKDRSFLPASVSAD
jgi:hypothetical protein